MSEAPSVRSELDAMRRAFRAFADEHIAPFAAEADRSGELPAQSLAALRDAGYVGANVPRDHGGLGLAPVPYGLLTGEIGRACSAARTLLTVHGLVAETVMRWGGAALKAELLPAMAAGTALGAIALSEAQAGSDAAAIETLFIADGDGLRIEGTKAWTSFGRSADWILVFGQLEGKPTAAVVPAGTPGLSRSPVEEMVGARGAAMAHLRFDGCRIPRDCLVGRAGLGLSHVAATALDHGRYSVAWGAVGIIDSCLDQSIDYARSRSQFGAKLATQPLVRAQLTRMTAMARSARLLCLHAGGLRAERHPNALVETMIAKYVASQHAVAAANAAVRLHGARGLSREWPVERLLRDAKVTEIIEGSTELMELLIGGHASLEP
jgi:alkylation response protein AidB-like acyl-CoA dehydrogenase